jgi:hypothetical protein
LKEADKATGLLELSMAGRVFMAAELLCALKSQGNKMWIKMSMIYGYR